MKCKEYFIIANDEIVGEYTDRCPGGDFIRWAEKTRPVELWGVKEHPYGDEYTLLYRASPDKERNYINPKIGDYK